MSNTDALLQFLGNRLREAREVKNLTLEEVAQATSISVDRLQVFEAGKGDPYLDESRPLCLLYDVTMDELAGLGAELIR